MESNRYSSFRIIIEWFIATYFGLTKTSSGKQEKLLFKFYNSNNIIYEWGWNPKFTKNHKGIFCELQILSKYMNDIT
jgi:hypothetical protein